MYMIGRDLKKKVLQVEERSVNYEPFRYLFYSWIDCVSMRTTSLGVVTEGKEAMGIATVFVRDFPKYLKKGGNSFVEIFFKKRETDYVCTSFNKL